MALDGHFQNFITKRNAKYSYNVSKLSNVFLIADLLAKINFFS